MAISQSITASTGETVSYWKILSHSTIPGVSLDVTLGGWASSDSYASGVAPIMRETVHIAGADYASFIGTTVSGQLGAQVALAVYNTIIGMAGRTTPHGVVANPFAGGSVVA